MGKGPQGRGSIIFDHEGAPCTDSKYHRHCRGRWRGILSKGFGPDGKRKQYEVSGRTKQDVIEALKKKSEELDAGLSTSRSYKVEAAAYDWPEHGLPGRPERTRELYRDAGRPSQTGVHARPAAALIVAARSRPALKLHGGLKDPRRPASLMHAYIVVSLMAGVRPGEARAIGGEEDVDLDGNSPLSWASAPAAYR